MHSWPSDWPIIHTFDPNHAKTWGQSRARPPLYKTNNLTGNMSSVPLSSPGGQFPLKIQFIVLLEIIGSVIPCEVRSKPLRIFLDSFCSNWQQIVIKDLSSPSCPLFLRLSISHVFPWKGQHVIYTKIKTKNIRVKEKRVCYAWIAAKISHDELYQGLDNMIQITMCI